MCCTDGFYLTRELNRGREKLKSIITSFIFILTILSQALCNISQVQQNINTLKSQGIENASNEKIRELYTQLDSQVQEHHKLSETYMDDMSKNAQAMHDKEQSTENKLLGTAGIGLTGIGGMQTLSAVAEQSADDSAQNDMRAYLSTFVCDYGNGTNVKYGDTQIELPGGNTLADLYEQYIALANDLKIRKATLDLPPGIESEPILDSATSGLYDDISIGKTSGTYTSLANAILTPDGPDAAAISDQESKTADKLKTGAITTGIGAIGSIAGNIIINKDAPTENSEKIKSEYESNRKKLETKITKTQTDLDLAIAENKEKISEYNTLLTKHQDFIKTITDPDCIDQFKSYTDYITTLTPITDNFADTSNLTFDYEIQEQQSEYNKCHAAAEALRKKIADCESKQNHKWIDDECVDQTPKTEIPENPDNTDDTQPPVAPDPDTVPPTADPDQCPAYNPRMRSLTDKNRVGDPCVYGDLTSGRVFKRSNGTCSCTALSCKTGYIVSRGVCIKQIKDSQGYCLRTEHPETAGKNNYTRLCETFCQNEAKQKGCKYKNSIMAHTQKKCICNPEQHEIESVQKKTQERQIKNTKFYDVCGSDSNRTGGTERCITEPFNWIQVQMLQATALAKEYALVKYNNNIICEKNTRSYEIDDWLSCSTTDNKIFYEFKFDDVKESVDSDIQQSVRRALCEKIYSGEMMSAKECKLSKADDVNKLINSAKKFAISATKKSGNYQNYVVFDHSFKTTYTTKKIKNIDPFAFFSQDIQIRANGKMIDGLYSYVAAKMAPTNVKTFTCNNNPIQIGGTIDGRKTVGMSDDVLTCYANGTPVDFVFDDMSESSETLSYGGYSNMNCTVVGGTYNGADCMNIGELECERIKKMASGDPVAKQARWNDTTKRCELPAAADATQMQRNINMSIMVGGVIVGMIVTVATGGTAGPALALLAVETAGGAIEIAATNKIYNEIDKFIDESQKCSSAKCAEQMLKTNLQRMANMTFDMTDAQKNGIDSELARLANLIPTNSEFYQKILENGPTTADNSKSMVDPDSWEPEQVWRAVGIALQLASIFNSIRKWVVGKFNALPRTTQAISGNASKLTATQAKRLDEIDARLARIQSELESNPSASRAAELRSERTRLTQEKNTISNKIGTKDPDEIAQAKTAAYNAKEIANARQELDNARTALQKRLDWESKQSPGALKNDLQSPRSFGRTARENVRAAEQKLRDMGESVTPMEFRSVDDILKNNTTSGTGTATRNSTNNANNAKNTSSTPTRTGADNAADAGRTSDNAAENATNNANNANNTASTPTRTGANNTADAGRTSDNAADAGPASIQNVRHLTKAEKINQARRLDNLGYHGTDADISMDDMIRPSANSSAKLGNTGYGIAKDYEAAEKYAIIRLIERQNINKNISFRLEYGTLLIESSEPLNLSKKIGYIYTTAKRNDIPWNRLGNHRVGSFEAAKMPEPVEILDKTTVNLDDLIRNGKVKIDAPNVTNANDAVIAEIVDDASDVGRNANRIIDVEIIDDASDVARATNATADAVHGAKLTVPSNFSQTAKNIVNDINELGTTKEYAIIRSPYSTTSEIPKTERNYIMQLINDRDDLISRTYAQPNGAGDYIGENRFIIKKTDDMFIGDEDNKVYRRINTKPVNSLRGQAITTIKGKQVFLEQLDNGGFIGEISGRPVVVVNYNGHKIPFYASSGSAGKLAVPTGKWEVFFGFAPNGWFNKTDMNAIVNHYNSPELKKIANALDDIIGDQRNVEDVFATISRKYYDGIGNVARYEGPAASRDFINQMLDFTPTYNYEAKILQRNVEHVKAYFNQ